MTQETSKKVEYMKVSEVAKMLNIDEQTVYKWSNNGKLKAIRIGRTYRFKSDDILAEG